MFISKIYNFMNILDFVIPDPPPGWQKWVAEAEKNKSSWNEKLRPILKGSLATGEFVGTGDDLIVGTSQRQVMSASEDVLEDSSEIDTAETSSRTSPPEAPQLPTVPSSVANLTANKPFLAANAMNTASRFRPGKAPPKRAEPTDTDRIIAAMHESAEKSRIAMESTIGSLVAVLKQLVERQD
jgi:hypothetical protein